MEGLGELNQTKGEERSQERTKELECRINERKHGRKRKYKKGVNRGNKSVTSTKNRTGEMVKQIKEGNRKKLRYFVTSGKETKRGQERR